MESTYARYLLKGGSLSKILDYLRRTGRTKMLPKILREVRNMSAYLIDHGSVRLAPGASVLQAHKDELGIDESATVTVDESLISGYLLTKGGRSIDTSAKKQLFTLYQKTINS